LFSLLPRTLLLPPVLFLLIALASWVVLRWRPRLGKALLGLSLLGLLVLALPITPALLFAGLEEGILLQQPASGTRVNAGDRPSPDLPPPAAIVILGGDGSFGSAGGAILGGAQPGNLSLERLRAGVALQRQSGLPILVTGGPSRPGRLPISVLMDRSLQQDFGVQSKWLEIMSVDTWENAAFTARILAQQGISSVYVVTHSWHLRRAQIAFRHYGIKVWPAPVSLPNFEGVRLEMFQPSVTAWLDSYLALHEWVGCAVYALRG
jgi:uncharacterized SAM-binding protein YcdF (DUF218 family)